MFSTLVIPAIRLCNRSVVIWPDIQVLLLFGNGNLIKIIFVFIIAILLQAKQFRTSHHYGYGGYGYNQYGQYANSRMDTVDENGDDMMKMVGSALDNFQKINDDDNDKLNMPDYFY